MRKIMALLALTACSGADGENGADGSDGQDGTNAEVVVGEASAEQCPSGGSVVTIGAEQVVLCNGQDAAGGSEPNESLGRIEASLHCGGPLANAAPLWASHSAVVFTNSSIWAQASIRDGFIEIGGSAFYSPVQKGAAEADVFFSFDVLGEPNGGFWDVTIEAASLDSVLTYEDSDIADGSMEWSMPSSSSGCVVNRY